MIPLPVFLNKTLSHTAKLIYGRLVYYGGKDGACYPTVATLAEELSITPRQARRCLEELEKGRFIKRNYRGRTSTFYTFLWHETFDNTDENVRDTRTIMSGIRGQKCPTEEIHLRESLKEKKADTDCPATDCTNRNPQLGACVLKQYPRLKEALHQYFCEEGYEDLYPTDRLVVDVMNAGAGASEQEVIQCLRYLYFERGLQPGTKNGPRHWSWFVTTVQDYFERDRERWESANPSGFAEWEDRNDFISEKRSAS